MHVRRGHRYLGPENYGAAGRRCLLEDRPGTAGTVTVRRLAAPTAADDTAKAVRRTSAADGGASAGAGPHSRQPRGSPCPLGLVLSTTGEVSGLRRGAENTVEGGALFGRRGTRNLLENMSHRDGRRYDLKAPPTPSVGGRTAGACQPGPRSGGTAGTATCSTPGAGQQHRLFAPGW